MNTMIVYCYDKERLRSAIGDHDIFSQLRMSSVAEKCLRCLVLTKPGINRRGSLKYATITFNNTSSITLKEVEEICKAAGYITPGERREDNKVVFSLLGNNLTALIKCIEKIIKLSSSYKEEEFPDVNLTTDLPTIINQEIYCCDYASFISMIQMTKLSEQSGFIYLRLDSTGDPNLPTLLLTCVNTRGRMKICLDCNELDRQIWVERAETILQELNVDFDIKVLNRLVICDSKANYRKEGED